MAGEGAENTELPNGTNDPGQPKAGNKVQRSTQETLAPGGGPKTPAGKKASSRNATRHGITSTSPVAGGESEEGWLVFFSGIRDGLSPVGVLEDEVVHNIAIALWQKRRIVRSTSGYIDSRRQYVEDQTASDPKSGDELALERFGIDIDETLDVLESIDNLAVYELTEAAFTATWVVLQMCPANGAKRDQVVGILPANLSTSIAELRCMAQALAKLNQIPMDALLKSAVKWAEQVASRVRRRERRRDAGLRAASLPFVREIDHLIRYDAHHDRSIAKNLQHLELLQRVRSGQDVPPPTRIQIEGDLPHAVGE